MKTLATALFCCAALTGTGAYAASHMEKAASAPMAGAGAMKKEMSMQECKDHMAMAGKDAMAKKDDAMMKKDAACAEMMKKDGMMKKDDGMMKKDGMAHEPMKK